MQKKSALIRFGDNIRRYRKQVDLSQEALAFESNLDRTYIGGAERGERNLSILSALKIAEALDISLSKLTEGVEGE